MLAYVTAAEFVRPMDSGRTCPLIVNCETGDGAIVTAVAKFSDFCDLRTANLAREVIGACLAADLGLPVPEPLLIEVPDGWHEVIGEIPRRQRVAASSRIAFGTRLITGGYHAWTPDTRITEAMFELACQVFAFDGITQNSDRRVGNPNCLVRGEEIRLIDHELAFAHRFILGWRPPWERGGLNWLERKGSHIFLADLRRNGGAEFATFQQRWSDISDDRLAEYRAVIPPEWNDAALEIDSALDLIRNARGNIASCITELRRVLT